MKDFYTHEQQIEKLKNKGLIIKNEDSAIQFLKLEGYYNVINGYSPSFKTKRGFFFVKEPLLRMYVVYMHLTRI